MAEPKTTDKAAAERAARLREQIERLKGGVEPPAEKQDNEKLSPREFIHKRMRELDRKS